MKFNKNRVVNHSLYEVSRKNIVGKTKSQSPDRYKRKAGYHPLDYKGIDIAQLLKDDLLVVKVPVGDYTCTLAYDGVLEELTTVLKAQSMPNVTLQSVVRSLQRSIDKTDILVDCTCADFVYRFAYWATKFGYKYGKPETRPAKKTNPDDKHGAVCKHLTAILSNKRWLVKLASTLNEYIKSDPDGFRNAMGLSEDEFFINLKGRPSSKTGRNAQMTTKQNALSKSDAEEVLDSDTIVVDDSPEANEEEEA